MYNCVYNRLPEDEPSGSKHVEDIKTLKHLLMKGKFCRFILRNYNTMRGTKEHTYFTFPGVSFLLEWPHEG